MNSVPRRPKSRKPRFLGLIAVFLLLSMSGCSLLFVKPPPPPQIWNRIGWARCTQHKAWPVIDTIFAVSSAVVAATPFIAGDPEGAIFDTTQTTVNVIQMAGWAFSAYYGFKTTTNCQRFWIHQMQRRNGQPPARANPYARPPPRQPQAPPAQPQQPPAQPAPEEGVLEPPPPGSAPPAAPNESP